MMKIYILEERDVWYSQSHIVKLGVFSSCINAVKAATQEYGKLQEDGSETHFEPINNPSNVKLLITEAYLDEFGEL